MQYERNDLLRASSARVKGIDFHPTEPWVLTTLYTGRVDIWSYESQSIIKSFELTDVPVRAGRFIARKNWIVCGSDDFQVRVYNYNTSEKITSFEAHPDYIRAIAVHPTHPFVLTASDDMTIKLWDWDRGWKCMRTYQGHSHYVMGLAINPKDTNTFASACLDRTVKVWSIGAETPNFTIEAHETKGVNYVDYYPHADNPYLLTTSDDQSVKIWDYTTKNAIHQLGGQDGNGGPDGHTSNVSFACYHPVLPLIISGSEDGTIKMWNSITYALEATIRYNLDRAWCVSYQRGGQIIAAGFDNGAIITKIGRDDPAITMDRGKEDNAKVIWYHKMELHMRVLPLKKQEASEDGTPVPLYAHRTEGCLMYPQSLSFSPNNQSVALCGNGQYSIRSAAALKETSYGRAADFVWGANTKTQVFAIRTIPKRSDEPGLEEGVWIITKSKEQNIQFGSGAEGLTGGFLLGVKASNEIHFFDWQTGSLVESLDLYPRHVYWSTDGKFVTLACDGAFHVLRYNRDEGTMETVTGKDETVRSGEWLGECFMYTTDENRLKYLVGEQLETFAHFDKPMYLLGYPSLKHSRIFLTDQDFNVVPYTISLPVIEYQTLVLRGNLEEAAEILEKLREKETGTDQEKSKVDQQLNRIARFLDEQGQKDMALDITQDLAHKFELAMTLNNLEVGLELAQESNLEVRWKRVGDAAMSAYDLTLAATCFEHAKDLGSLLLLYTAVGNHSGLQDLVSKAEEQAANNIAFTALFTLGDIDGCLDLLIRSNRAAEAVLFSKTYKPSRCRDIVTLWKGTLEKSGKNKVSKMLAIPPGPEEGEQGDANLFPEWEESLKLEKDGLDNSLQPPTPAMDGGIEAHKESGENGIAEDDADDVVDEA